MTFRARWRKDEELLSRPAGPTKEEFTSMMEEIHKHDANPFAAEEESSQAFIDSARCVRWGSGEDRCTLAFEHCGPCVDAKGNSTLTLAAAILRGRK